MNHELANSIGYLIGSIAIPALIVFGGFAWAKSLNKKHEGFESVRWPIYVCMVIALLAVLGQCSASQIAKPTGQAPTDSADEAIEVNDGMTSQPFPGRFDSAALEQNRIALTNALGARYSKELGVISSKMSTIRLGGKTVILFDATGSAGPKIVQYIGVLGGNRKTVSCTSMNGSITSACEAKAIEVFGPLDTDENPGAKAHG